VAKSADLGLNFLNTGRNKRSLVMDLKNPQAHEIMTLLLKDADVLISNMRPGALARLGLDYASVSRIHSKIVYVNLVGFSSAGPYAGLPAYDDLIQAACGIPWLMQQANGGEPCYVPLALSDRVVGLACLNPLLAALFSRERTGQGREIEVPMFETMARLVLGDHLGEQVYCENGGAPGYARLLSPHRRPYKTRDGYIAVLPFEGKHWRRLFEAAGREDPTGGSFNARTANFDVMYAALSELIAQKTTREWVTILTDAEVPFMPVNSVHDLLEDPQLNKVGFFKPLEHPSEGKVRMVVVPEMSVKTRFEPAPHLGQHTTEILREIGLSEDRIRGLLEQDVVRQGASGGRSQARVG
jgi:crotonobetainyl-CoA:carnitine CoA-transferase CaiB-like acyl-CoA transferase